MEAQIITPETTDRATLYTSLLPQVEALLHGERDAIAAMANMTAALHQTFGWHWVGFYRVVDDELVLGPFQGPVACARIGFGKGVCGTAWKEERAIIVPDVDLFPGHIACSALSRSEIVLPVRTKGGHVVGLLDVDATEPNAFSTEDEHALEQFCDLLQPLFG